MDKLKENLKSVIDSLYEQAGFLSMVSLIITLITIAPYSYFRKEENSIRSTKDMSGNINENALQECKKQQQNCIIVMSVFGALAVVFGIIFFIRSKKENKGSI